MTSHIEVGFIYTGCGREMDVYKTNNN